MHDLIYVGDLDLYAEVGRDILAQYPAAKLNQVYDDIHEYRMEVDVENVTEHDWLKFAIKQGIGQISFVTRMFVNDPDHIAVVRKVIDEIKREEVAENLICQK